MEWIVILLITILNIVIIEVLWFCQLESKAWCSYLTALIYYHLLTSSLIMAVSTDAADPPKPKEAVKWLYQASIAGHVRAQYQLALCLHQGRGLDRNLQVAVRSSYPCLLRICEIMMDSGANSGEGLTNI